MKCNVHICVLKQVANFMYAWVVVCKVCTSLGIRNNIIKFSWIAYLLFYLDIYEEACVPIPVDEQSKAWVCGCLLAGIVGSNPDGSLNACLLLSVMCCQVEVSASG